jgi:hypothetical protein
MQFMALIVIKICKADICHGFAHLSTPIYILSHDTSKEDFTSIAYEYNNLKAL